MRATRAVAIKPNKNVTVSARRHKNTQSGPDAALQSRPWFPFEQVFIQRKKNACSCGGRCPKCLGNLGIQPELEIGAPDDKYEQEADRMADRLVQTPEPHAQLGCNENLVSDPSVKGLDPKSEDGNVMLDDDPIHGPLIDEFRRREAELGNPAATELSDAGLKYGGLLGACPARTGVDRTINLTPIALRQGWRTAYGIAAIMQVFPGERTWDGTRITETVSTRSNTCPPRVAGGACSGNSTFTVGASGRSARIGRLPGRVNRFYDFHVSKWRTGSLLHDRGRNPRNVDNCRVVCDQNYSCSGTVIGRHRITRDYSKGTHNGHDVTIVNITKS